MTVKSVAEPGDETALAAFAELISEQLTEERATRTSLEQRGVNLVTTSGAFTTLVLGVAALVGEDKLVDASRWLLVLSLVAFVVAAVLGVLVNKPVDVEESSETSLRSALDKHADKTFFAGQKAAAENRLLLIRHARVANASKACWLRAGTVAQIGAMALVGLAGIVALIP